MAIGEVGAARGSEAWETIEPQVDANAEFLEIARDFGNPLEIVREAVSNSIDAGAKRMRISFSVEDVDGHETLVARIEDDGRGMTRGELSRDFWGLGFSKGRGDSSKIGEKGHGTKIYLRAEEVRVLTCGEGVAFESVCERPMRALTRREKHQPKIRQVQPAEGSSGTSIRIYDYNGGERSMLVQEVVKDYIYWFTKFGSIERLFGLETLADLKIELKCLDADEFEELSFGHPFPAENADIDRLFEEHGTDAADLYVKRYMFRDRLRELPEVTYDAIISVEGEQAKRSYNRLIGQRRRQDTGRYRVSDRYGLWLCKDFIPVQRINDWIVGFGTGSNSFTLLHGFINCQRLKLTANRGSIANTDPKVLDELRKAVQAKLDTINSELTTSGIFTLFDWQSEQRTVSQEKGDFEARTKSLRRKSVATLDGQTLFEPRNEAELFGLFCKISAVRPELFEFEPLDYNTSKGIDIIARNKSDNTISESGLWYVELKYLLLGTLNHGFRYLRIIVCWDFHPTLRVGSEVTDIQGAEQRVLQAAKDEDGHTIYFLDSKAKAVKIQVIRLREFLFERLGVQFTSRA